MARSRTLDTAAFTPWPAAVMATPVQGRWPSIVQAEMLVSTTPRLSEVQVFENKVYWLEQRPSEAGRTVLLTDLTHPEELTTGKYSVHSRVHEYGGGAYCVGAAGVFFVNAKDQNIYQLKNDQITQLTDSDANTRYADLTWCEQHECLLAVIEIHPQTTHSDQVQSDQTATPQEPENALVALFPTSEDQAHRQLFLHRGYDFYSSPTPSFDGEQLAFVVWNHPNMPWDGTQLLLAEFNGQALNNIVCLAGGTQVAVGQPKWRDAKSLMFVSDEPGFCNLYCHDSSGTYCLLEDSAEYAGPPWVFGLSNYSFVDANHVVASRKTSTGAELVLIDCKSASVQPFHDMYNSYEYVIATQDRVLVCAGFKTSGARVVSLGTQDGLELAAYPTPPAEKAADSGPDELPIEWISTSQNLQVTTADDQLCFAHYYPPINADFAPEPDDKPPLLVLTHGGPTSATSTDLNMRIQFYTSRGWAVVDVDYRGSTGYGKKYREALNGQWGVAEVVDCEAVVRHLVQHKLADQTKVAIRGGSAGGFTTLRALTTSTLFSAGASHYGIGDLTALAADTHKFESRYLDGLIGPTENYNTRSPLNHTDGFSCPVIFFQGSEDRVVPPNQSRQMVEVLRRKSLPVAYIEFAGEGHGFRNEANICRAVQAEYEFFCRVFKLRPTTDHPNADPRIELDIENI